ncbi:hypothetical protein UPYG_G00256110 [Umbra pygmaea]|uniref:Uncharacterized protein n=1 Tax=Umbra pygmaea TaxID=75934 RepID=A0ABD0W9Y8_UMBPY
MTVPCRMSPALQKFLNDSSQNGSCNDLEQRTPSSFYSKVQCYGVMKQALKPPRTLEWNMQLQFSQHCHCSSHLTLHHQRSWARAARPCFYALRRSHCLPPLMCTFQSILAC